MITTAEIRFMPEPIDTALEQNLEKTAKRFKGEFFFSEAAVGGSRIGERLIGYDFPSKGKALGYLRAAKLLLKKHGKKLTKAFTRESLTDPNN